jgi:hypothetical protein
MEPRQREPDLKAAFTDHDHLFKELISCFFFEFVQLFAPRVARMIDPDSLTLLEKEFFTDITTGDKHILDLVARAKLRGRDTFIIFHVEAQASARPHYTRRMFLYFSDIFKEHQVDIYPIALFTFDEPFREEPDRFTMTFPGLRVLDFAFHGVQLNRLDWRKFARSRNPAAIALMAKMRIAPEDRWRVKLECLRLLAKRRLDPARTQLISGFIDSYLKLTASELQAFQAAIESLPVRERKATVPLTISWKEEGLQQGLQQGRAEGELAGRTNATRALVLKVGEQRFGALDAATARRMEAIQNLDQLEALVDRLVTATSWIDLLD